MSFSLSLTQAPSHHSHCFLKSATQYRVPNYRIQTTVLPVFSSSSLSNFSRSMLTSSMPFTDSTVAMAKVGSAAMEGVDENAFVYVVQKRLMLEDECILVDENDNVVGHDSKFNCHLMKNIEKNNHLHRSFSVILFNSKHELLLHQRSLTKITFPLVWTNTCCSHPLYMESELIEENSLGVKNAAQRKLIDELGIPAEELPVDEFIPVGRMIYKAASDRKWGEHELDHLLIIVRDVELRPNPNEVADVKYFNRKGMEELLQKADAGEAKISPWFRLIADNFLPKWWDHLEKGTLLDAADMKTIYKF